MTDAPDRLVGRLVIDSSAIAHVESLANPGTTICGLPILLETTASQTSACWTCFRPTASEPSSYEAEGHIFMAMTDLAYFGNMRPTVSVRGAHGTWTCVTAGEHEFNIDDETDRARLIAWGHAVRSRPANTEVPAP